jgi:PAS domain S-box-containing protein
MKSIMSTNVPNDKDMFTDIIDNIPTGVIVLDNNFNIIIWNSAQEKISTVHRKTVVGKSFFKFFSDTFNENIKLKIRNIIETEETIILDNFLIQQLFSNECYKYFNIKISPLKNKSGVIFTIEDCTMLEDMNYQLRKSKEMLKKQCADNEVLIKKFEKDKKLLTQIQEVDKLRTEFFANISHELRTPLNIILSALQLINPFNNLKLSKEKSYKYLNSVRQNSFRLLRLINNLIDLTKMDAGYFEIHPSNHNIINIIEDITLSVAQYAENKNITLTFDTDIEEKTMACDPEKIERIMLNLISNSIKFTEPGGNIFINIWDKKSHIVISVKDTGIGIPKNNLDVIFERFRQVHKNSSENNEGSGIGLSLVKSLVEMHGGHISVNSTFGKGSEFIIKLPVTTKSHNTTSINQSELSESHVQKINIEFSDIYPS